MEKRKSFFLVVFFPPLILFKFKGSSKEQVQKLQVQTLPHPVLALPGAGVVGERQNSLRLTKGRAEFFTSTTCCLFPGEQEVFSLSSGNKLASLMRIFQL
jgi:hypothetical protein